MKTIGIITIHKSTSYGACLQAHALWKFLQLKGFNCEIIDLYRNIHKGFIPSQKYITLEPPHIGKSINKSNVIILSYALRTISKILSYTIYRKSDKLRKYRFEKFNSLVTYSKPYKCIDQLYNNPPSYDIYLTGSDQVWNPTIGIPLEPFFLTFTDSPNKISYASSFGISNLKNDYQTLFKPWLMKYKFISCREHEGAQIIHNITGKNVPVCLDPTLLIGAKYWKSISIAPKYVKPYLLLFFLKGISPEVLKYCEQIANKENLKIIILGKTSLSITFTHKCIADAGPKEFIGWIQHANIVITDSFHGLAFSLMLNNCFYVKLDNEGKKESRNSRIETILSEFDLHDRILNLSIKGKPTNPVNRTQIDYILDIKRKESIKYLNNSLI